MFDIWQPVAAQQVRSVADVQEIDAPRVTGITQLNSYYQNVLGAPPSGAPQGPSNAVTVAGELNAYLGSADGGVDGRFPSSRASLGHVGTAAPGQSASTSADDVSLSGLLPATAPVRAQAQAGEWSSLAGWKSGPSSAYPGSSVKAIEGTAIAGDTDQYVKAWQSAPSPAAPESAVPRVTSREEAGFMDHSDYSHSADPLAAFGQRAEDTPSRQVADLVAGFTRLPEK